VARLREEVSYIPIHSLLDSGKFVPLAEVETWKDSGLKLVSELSIITGLKSILKVVLTIIRITTLITPLLRRMVTNEKQRQYATERREEQRAKEKENAKLTELSDTPAEKPALLSPYPEVDPKLDEYHLNVAPYLPADLVESPPPDIQNGPELFQEAEESALTYHVNLVENRRRLKPKLTLTPATCPGFASLVQHIHNLLDDGDKKMKSIRALGPYGQVNIGDEDAWREVTTIVKEEEWMDGEVKIIVHLEEKS
jgi:hypothetical protein